MIKIIGFIIAILCLTPTYSGTIDPNVSDQLYVKYGESFDFICSISGQYKDKTFFAASAVIIDSHHIITAAHVIKGVESCFITIKDKTYPLSNLVYHEKYQDKIFGLYDIAIAYSKEDLGLSFYPPLYESSDEVGKICCISGYGLTGTFATGAVRHDSKRRAGSNKIDYIDKQLLMCTASHRKDKQGFTSLEFLIASGDSGGGLFIEGKLAGINSCVISANKDKILSKYGCESGHTRISHYIDWIKKHANEK